MPKKYFVSAIGTDSGKTLISAIILEALKGEYWKPIQSGIEIRDTKTVRKLVSKECRFHNETYLLQSPMSPHAAAKLDYVTINLDKIVPPKHNNDLVIEGAGGLMVPLNDTEFIIDLIKKIDCELILVSDIYLGSINHTLLSINELNRHDIPVKGIIFNGDENKETTDYILKYSGYKELLHVKREKHIDGFIVKKYAQLLAENW